jgi:small conductance mechanosensitive channel
VAVDDQLETIQHLKRTLVDLAVQFGPRLVTALLIFAAGFLVSGWVENWATRLLDKLDLEPPVRMLLARITRVLVLILFVIMALQNLGVELLPLIAGLGVVGAGIALAMQGVLSNVAAGLSIIFTKPYRVGEYISIAHEEGEVRVITLFSTTLGHPDRSRVVIPNRKIAGEILHNFGRIRQLDVVVGVSYGTDVAAARAAIEAVLAANPRILRDPRPLVQVGELSDWSVDIAVKPWVSVGDFGAASGEIQEAILRTFRERGLEVPFPTHDVRVQREPRRTEAAGKR